MRGISYGRVDHLGVKRRVLVGHVGIEEYSGFGAVPESCCRSSGVFDLSRVLGA
jgi:hypothetical protein